MADSRKAASEKAATIVWAAPDRRAAFIAQVAARTLANCGCENCRAGGRFVDGVFHRNSRSDWPRHFLGFWPLSANSFAYLELLRALHDRYLRPVFKSYECHLEDQAVDWEIEEDLAKLRNDPERVGVVVVDHFWDDRIRPGLCAWLSTPEVEAAARKREEKIARDEYHARRAEELNTSSGWKKR